MGQNKNDFDAASHIKRVDELEAFKKEYEGKAFEDKVLKSIQDSKPISKEISSIIWETIKSKIIWIIATCLVLIATNFIISAMDEIVAKIFHAQGSSEQDVVK